MRPRCIPRKAGAVVGAQAWDPWRWWAAHAPKEMGTVVGAQLWDPWRQQESAPVSGVLDGSSGSHLPLEGK